jgi:hypothetical protein
MQRIRNFIVFLMIFMSFVCFDRYGVRAFALHAPISARSCNTMALRSKTLPTPTMLSMASSISEENIEWKAFQVPADDVINAIDNYQPQTSLSTVADSISFSDQNYKRLTVSDVSALTGRDLKSARENLILLAALIKANLQVTNDGDIIYLFPKGQSVRNTLRSQSAALKMREFTNTLAGVLSYVFRISFGLALIASIAIIFTSLATVSSSSNSSSNDRERKSSNMPLMFDSSFIDIIFRPMYRPSYRSVDRDIEISSNDASDILDPFTSPINRRRARRISFLESFYSYIFGDENPNSGELGFLFYSSCSILI